MLDILVNNISLDYHSDIQISLTIENPMLLEDRIPLPYSISFELPPTPKNLQIFGFPNRIGSYKDESSLSTFPCVIRFSAIIIAKGHLKLISYFDSIKVQFVGSDVNEDLNKKMFDFDFGRETFAGSFDTFDFENSNNFAHNYKIWAEDASKGLNEKLVVAPLAFSSNAPEPKLKTSADYYKGTFPFHYSSVFYQRNIFLHAGYIIPHWHQDFAWLNMFNPSNQTFSITGSPMLNVTLAHANIFPLFRLSWMLSQIFTNGLFINAFNDSILDDIVVPTFYFPKWTERHSGMGSYSKTQATPPMTSNLKWKDENGFVYPDANSYDTLYPKYDESPFIDYSEFLPDVFVNEFLKEILKLFSFQLIMVRGRFGIISSNEIMSAPVKNDWSSKMIGRPEFSIFQSRQYKYGYSEKSEAQISDVRSISEVETLYDLSAIELDPKEDEDDIRTYFVKETNSYYQMKGILSKFGRSGGTNQPFDDEVLLTIEVLGEKTTDTGEVTKSTYSSETKIVKPLMVPAPHFVTLDRTSPGYPETYFYKLPLIVGDRAARPQSISLLIFQGDKAIDKPIGSITPKFPSVTNKTENLSFDWDGENGLIEKYHSSFKNWIERDKLKVSGTFLLNPIDLHQLDISAKTHIQGRNFFFEKIQITIGKSSISPALIDFVEA
ncbi:hypothetical protein [Sphingobacterium sp.]|uniref:hypothetical protein n=1 Tax=Sphingobacterium sp. TaxID=341027 RepID=UPI00289AEC90|nr:hypothetical protein [Sphingobacterium sp.]